MILDQKSSTSQCSEIESHETFWACVWYEVSESVFGSLISSVVRFTDFYVERRVNTPLKRACCATVLCAAQEKGKTQIDQNA